MNSIKNQNYEKYWKLTLEYTNFNDSKFLNTLQLIVNKIDELNSDGNYVYSSEDNKQLQEDILKKTPKSSNNKFNQLGSIRKAINQCVKLGFINPKYYSYHEKTKLYLEARTSRRRKTILSEIIYSNSKFNASITKEHNWNQINFLIKTLEEIGNLNKEDLIAMMTINLDEFSGDYITRKELDKYVNNANKIGFIKRKYNQISYLTNLLKKLDDVIFYNNKLYFEEDAQIIFGNDLNKKSFKRDDYLHRLYKNKLKEESLEKEGVVNCMVEHLDYPSLVASHIIPFILADNNVAYDFENGLLLSRNMDILFDQGYISFCDNGKIMISNKLSSSLKKNLSNYNLKNVYLTEKRKLYLEYHRKNVFKK
ncbi:MAG: HNH endonuclease [Candidatus Muiribacteriota bacterium]